MPIEPRSSATVRAFSLLRRVLVHFAGAFTAALLVLPFLLPLVAAAQSLPGKTVVHLTEAEKSYRAGLVLVRQGQPDEGIRMFEQGLRSDERNVVLLDAIGGAFSLKGDYSQAVSYFSEALMIDRHFTPARKNLAIAYFNLQQYDLASRELHELENDPGEDGQVARMFLGMIAAKDGEDARAVTLFGKAADLLNRYPDALISFARALNNRNQPGNANALLNRLTTLKGVTAEQYRQAGVLYLQMSRDRQALSAFERAERAGATLEDMAYHRAVTLDKLGRSPEALQLLQESVAAKPDSASLNLLAHLAQKSGDLTLALHSLKLAAKLEPGKEENYLDFSTFCADYENYPLALEAAEIGLEHIPNSYRLTVQKGAVLEKLGRLEDAEQILRQASGLQEDNSVALLSLAIVQAHADELQQSAETVSAAIHRFPDNYYMRYHLGSVLAQLEQRETAGEQIRARAEQAFRDAIRLNPTFADSYYQLAKLYSAQAPKLAEENFEACLRVDPNHLPAEYSLGRLYLKTGRRAKGQALIDRFESQQQAAKQKEESKPRITASRP